MGIARQETLIITLARREVDKRDADHSASLQLTCFDGALPQELAPDRTMRIVRCMYNTYSVQYPSSTYPPRVLPSSIVIRISNALAPYARILQRNHASKSSVRSLPYRVSKSASPDPSARNDPWGPVSFFLFLFPGLKPHLSNPYPFLSHSRYVLRSTNANPDHLTPKSTLGDVSLSTLKSPPQQSISVFHLLRRPPLSNQSINYPGCHQMPSRRCYPFRSGDRSRSHLTNRPSLSIGAL